MGFGDVEGSRFAATAKSKRPATPPKPTGPPPGPPRSAFLPTCRADLDGNGVVNADDLGRLLAAWT